MVLSGCCCPSGGLMARLCNRWPDGTVPDTPGAAGVPRVRTARRQARPARDNCEGYYNHPRFHPVPTQPVFGPRTESLAACSNQKGTPDGSAPGAPKGVPSPSVPSSPKSGPELMPLPPTPPNPPTTKRGDAAPERLAVAPADGSSWIFAPSLPPSAVGLTEPKVEVKTELSAKDQQTLR